MQSDVPRAASPADSGSLAPEAGARDHRVFEIYYYLAGLPGWAAMAMNSCILINKKPRKPFAL
jgi:hypothetical protein